MKNFIIAAVKDELTDTFLQPIFGETKEELLRVFKYLVNNTTIWKENPSDFSFYMIGTYNDNTGVIKPSVTKIANGMSVIERKENE